MNSERRCVVQTVRKGSELYELCYVLCGKSNCRSCQRREGGSELPRGHGPYWYLCVGEGRRRRRLYVGKELDTAKYRDGAGVFQWHLVAASKEARAKGGEGV